MNYYTAVYVIMSDNTIIDKRNVEESQLSMACAYGHELSNRHGREVELRLHRKPVTYSFQPDPKRAGRDYVPPETGTSPSVCDFLNAGD